MWLMNLEHHLNPLHVYCRLKDVGVPRPDLFGKGYEKTFHPVIHRTFKWVAKRKLGGAYER